MPTYKCKAVTAGGQVIEGEYEAVDERSLVGMMQQRGYYVTKVTKQGLDVNSLFNRPKKVPIKLLARFCLQMASLIKSGVPLARSMEILKGELSHQGMRKIMDEAWESINEGQRLSAAFEPFAPCFPMLFLSMIEAGEASGTLDACLERAGESFTKTARMNSKIKGAMIYPAIILVVLFGLLIIMLLFVIPQFAVLYQDAGADLPGFTQMLLAAPGFIMSYWYIFVIAVGIIVVGFQVAMQTDKGRTGFDKMKTRLPAIKKLVAKIYAARFSRNIASLNSAGVSLPKTIEVTAKTMSNRFLEKKIYGMLEDIDRGLLLSVAMERMGQLPPIIVSVTRLGEESGDLDTMLIQIADYFDEESDQALSALMAMMEPALIVIMAAIIVPILVGALSPMFNMINVLM